MTQGLINAGAPVNSFLVNKIREMLPHKKPI